MPRKNINKGEVRDGKVSITRGQGRRYANEEVEPKPCSTRYELREDQVNRSQLDSAMTAHLKKVPIVSPFKTVMTT